MSTRKIIAKGFCLILVLLGIPLEILSQSHRTIYHKGWIDFNKNGIKDIYEDITQDLNKRADDLLSQMTLEEKSCQLATLYGFGRVLKDSLPTKKWKDEIWKDGIANIDEQLNGVGSGLTRAPQLIVNYQQHVDSTMVY